MLCSRKGLTIRVVAEEDNSEDVEVVASAAVDAKMEADMTLYFSSIAASLVIL